MSEKKFNAQELFEKIMEAAREGRAERQKKLAEERAEQERRRQEEGTEEQAKQAARKRKRREDEHQALKVLQKLPRRVQKAVRDWKHTLPPQVVVRLVRVSEANKLDSVSEIVLECLQCDPLDKLRPRYDPHHLFDGRDDFFPAIVIELTGLL